MGVRQKRGTGERMAWGSKTLPEKVELGAMGPIENFKVRLRMLD